MRLLLLLTGLVALSRYVLAAEMKASEVIAKSEAAYSALKSYEGTTTVRNRTEIGGHKLDQTATAKIAFVRPGKMRIEGRDATSKPYVIISNGKNTWRSWAVEGGAFKRETNLELAVAGMTGVAAMAPTTIPAALLKLNWGYPFTPARIGAPKITGHERVDGMDCHIVVVDSDLGKHTYWIDRATFLLRRLKEEQNEKQLAAMQTRSKEVMKQHGKHTGPDHPPMTMKSRETLQSFKIDKVNGSPAEKLFADPTRK